MQTKMVRDLFCDDKFRPKWDDMLAYSATIEKCPTTGTMVVQWIRKGVSWPSIPRRNKPKRVDFYYSSWCNRAVDTRRGKGQLTACEALPFHQEDTGIPWEIAKLGIRLGMWGTVKKIEHGLRAYQKGRVSLAPLSGPASMAQINTKINTECLRSLESHGDLSKSGNIAVTSEKPLAKSIARVLIFGGVIILACSLDHGLLNKALIFGMGRRFANRRKR